MRISNPASRAQWNEHVWLWFKSLSAPNLSTPLVLVALLAWIAVPLGLAARRLAPRR
jgi:hypothetical protein